jgi:hypothetical protein
MVKDKVVIRVRYKMFEIKDIKNIGVILQYLLYQHVLRW